MESFLARFPRIGTDSGYRGWFVSTLLLLAWLGSLINGPIADKIGRKGSMLLAVVVFTIGSAFQAGADSAEMLFAGTLLPPFEIHQLNDIQVALLPVSLSACSP